MRANKSTTTKKEDFDDDRIDSKCAFNLHMQYYHFNSTSILAEMRRRSYALAVTIAVGRSWSINEESPAAAAAASKWPIFDF